MAPLGEYQIEVDGLLMGIGTTYIAGIPQWSGPDVTDNLKPVPRGDGQRRGRSYRGGRTLELDIWTDTYTESAGELAAAALERTWDAEESRATPGAVSVLRYRRSGATRRVYGWCGKIDPTNQGIDWTGNFGYQAEFLTTDRLFYDDEVTTTVVPFVPAALGGLVGPQIGGWTATTAGVASGRVPVGGSAPAWLAWTIHGPITNPTIEVVDRWSATLRVTLAYDQSITVDPTPWVRSVRRNDGANFAGQLTAESVRLSKMRVPPGMNQVLLRGIDPSGTSYLTTSVRAAHSAS